MQASPTTAAAEAAAPAAKSRRLERASQRPAATSATRPAKSPAVAVATARATPASSSPSARACSGNMAKKLSSSTCARHSPTATPTTRASRSSAASSPAQRSHRALPTRYTLDLPPVACRSKNAIKQNGFPKKKSKTLSLLLYCEGLGRGDGGGRSSSWQAAAAAPSPANPSLAARAPAAACSRCAASGSARLPAPMAHCATAIATVRRRRKCSLNDARLALSISPKPAPAPTVHSIAGHWQSRSRSDGMGWEGMIAHGPSTGKGVARWGRKHRVVTVRRMHKWLLNDAELTLSIKPKPVAAPTPTDWACEALTLHGAVGEHEVQRGGGEGGREGAGAVDEAAGHAHLPEREAPVQRRAQQPCDTPPRLRLRFASAGSPLTLTVRSLTVGSFANGFITISCKVFTLRDVGQTGNGKTKGEETDDGGNCGSFISGVGFQHIGKHDAKARQGAPKRHLQHEQFRRKPILPPRIDGASGAELEGAAYLVDEYMYLQPCGRWRACGRRVLQRRCLAEEKRCAEPVAAGDCSRPRGGAVAFPPSNAPALRQAWPLRAGGAEKRKGAAALRGSSPCAARHPTPIHHANANFELMIPRVSLISLASRCRLAWLGSIQYKTSASSNLMSSRPEKGFRPLQTSEFGQNDSSHCVQRDGTTEAFCWYSPLSSGLLRDVGRCSGLSGHASFSRLDSLPLFVLYGQCEQRPLSLAFPYPRVDSASSGAHTFHQVSRLRLPPLSLYEQCEQRSLPLPRGCLDNQWATSIACSEVEARLLGSAHGSASPALRRIGNVASAGELDRREGKSATLSLHRSRKSNCLSFRFPFSCKLDNSRHPATKRGVLKTLAIRETRAWDEESVHCVMELLKGTFMDNGCSTSDPKRTSGNDQLQQCVVTRNLQAEYFCSCCEGNATSCKQNLAHHLTSYLAKYCDGRELDVQFDDEVQFTSRNILDIVVVMLMAEINAKRKHTSYIQHILLNEGHLPDKSEKKSKLLAPYHCTSRSLAPRHRGRISDRRCWSRVGRYRDLPAKLGKGRERLVGRVGWMMRSTVSPLIATSTATSRVVAMQSWPRWSQRASTLRRPECGSERNAAVSWDACGAIPFRAKELDRCSWSCAGGIVRAAHRGNNATELGQALRRRVSGETTAPSTTATHGGWCNATMATDCKIKNIWNTESLLSGAPSADASDERFPLCRKCRRRREKSALTFPNVSGDERVDFTSTSAARAPPRPKAAREDDRQPNAFSQAPLICFLLAQGQHTVQQATHGDYGLPAIRHQSMISIQKIAKSHVRNSYNRKTFSHKIRPILPGPARIAGLTGPILTRQWICRKTNSITG
ncbi:Protein of unknown function [Gryllus bimaculatus]|nr:Protein of unknown function [Gryllus bimaculatus]